MTYQATLCTVYSDWDKVLEPFGPNLCSGCNATWCYTATTPKVSLFKGLHLCRLCPRHEAGRMPSYHEFQSNPHVSPFGLFFCLLNISLPTSSSLWTALHACRRSKVIRRERIWILAFLILCLSAFLWKVYILSWLVDNDYMQTSLDMQMT